MRVQLFDMSRYAKPQGPLWGVARRYAWTVPVVAGGGFLATILEGLGISLLIPLLGTLLNAGSAELPGRLSVLSDWTARFPPDLRLIVIGAAIFGFTLLKAAVQIFNTWFIAWVDGKASHDVRLGLARGLLEIGYPFFLRQDSNRLITIIATDSWRASDALRLGFAVVAGLAASLVFFLFLVMVNWKLTLAVAVGALVIRGIQIFFVRRAQRLSKAFSAANERLTDRMIHIVQGMRVVRLFGQEARELDDFQAASVEVSRAVAKVHSLNGASASIVEVSHAALFIGTLIGAYFAGVPLPALVTFLVLLYRFQPFLRQLSSARLAIASIQKSVDDVDWLLDPPDRDEPPKGRLTSSPGAEDITFEGVSFSYPGETRGAPAIKQASFRIVSGRTTALIGSSGSGKSTVINLICRLLEPTTGRILVGSQSLSELDPVTWRRRLAFAGQDADLIEGSLADNIRYGSPAASRAEVEEAARLAQIDSFIDTLPQGFDTQVGSRGMGLSGGQRQRIALARAFVRKPDLLILDEATNAVDALSEGSILALIEACSWKLTTLIVSHRPSTLSLCEDGIVLQGGEVVAAAPLAELQLGDGGLGVEGGGVVVGR